MQEVDSILEKLDNDGDIVEIRIAIADLIIDQLRRVRGSFGYLEKFFFASAIAAFAFNIGSRYQPTNSWLRLCLVDLEKALEPAEQWDENYAPQDAQLESLTCDQLMDDIETMRKSGL